MTQVKIIFFYFKNIKLENLSIFKIGSHKVLSYGRKEGERMVHGMSPL